MAAIATGTVVLWEVVNRGTPNERVEYVSDKQVSLYVADGSEQDDATAILAKYILNQVNKAAANQQLAKAKDLLKAASDGLLRVSDITRAPITPPSVR